MPHLGQWREVNRNINSKSLHQKCQQQKLTSEMFFMTVLDKLNVVLFQVEAYALGIKCPLLVIKASNSPYYMSEEIAERLIKIYIRWIDWNKLTFKRQSYINFKEQFHYKTSINIVDKLLSLFHHCHTVFPAQLLSFKPISILLKNVPRL